MYCSQKDINIIQPDYVNGFHKQQAKSWTRNKSCGRYQRYWNINLLPKLIHGCVSMCWLGALFKAADAGILYSVTFQ